MAVLYALRESYINFLDSIALRDQDPDKFREDGWYDPEPEIVEKFKNAIDKLESGGKPEKCKTEFSLSSPPRSIVICGKYSENMAKLTENCYKSLYDLQYELSIISYLDLKTKSREIEGIRICGNDHYELAYTTDESGELSLWNIWSRE